MRAGFGSNTLREYHPCATVRGRVWTFGAASRLSRALCASASDAHARGARVGRARARVGRLERHERGLGRHERDVVRGVEPVLPRARADCQSARRPRGRARARAPAPSLSPVLPLEMGLYLGLFPVAPKPRNPTHVSSDMSSESQSTPHASSDDSWESSARWRAARASLIAPLLAAFFAAAAALSR